MIVLDTNVLSEVMRAQPDMSVLDWLDIQPTENLWLTAITVAEILHGIARLPDGKRKANLLDAAQAMIKDDFSARILSFDEVAATYYATLVSCREQLGRPISMADAQIAAICLSHAATLATRNTKDFTELSLALINPWQEIQ